MNCRLLLEDIDILKTEGEQYVNRRRPFWEK